MKSLEHELGLTGTTTGSSYFDYIEQKLASREGARASVVESGPSGSGLVEFVSLVSDENDDKA